MGSQFEKDTNSKFLGQCLFFFLYHHVVREGLKRLSEKDREEHLEVTVEELGMSEKSKKHLHADSEIEDA